HRVRQHRDHRATGRPDRPGRPQDQRPLTRESQSAGCSGRRDRCDLTVEGDRAGAAVSRPTARLWAPFPTLRSFTALLDTRAGSPKTTAVRRDGSAPTVGAFRAGRTGWHGAACAAWPPTARREGTGTAGLARSESLTP